MVPLCFVNQSFKVTRIRMRPQQGFISKWYKIQVATMKNGTMLRGASYYGHQVQRTLDKLPLRGQGKSSLKYTLWSLHKFGIKVCYLEKSLGFHNYGGQTILHQANSWHQNSQKALPCRNIRGIVLWPLAFNVKAKQTNFCSPSITLLESFVCSTNGCCMKCL